MPDSNTPIVLVVCNDYGELAFAMYLLERQPFAQNTTLMLPPRLFNHNPDVLPGRTFVYHSLDDIRNKMDSQKLGILGLFSGYLLPIHRLCEPDALDSLLRSTQAKGWRCFTTDPFLGLLEDIEPGKLVTLKPPTWSIIWFVLALIGRRRAKRVLTDMYRILQGMLHIYPCGNSTSESEQSFEARLHFHNNAFVSQPEHHPPSHMPTTVPEENRWLFVLGDQDYTLQKGKYGQLFPRILMRKLHETLEAGRVPILVGPTEIIETVRKHSPVAHAMVLQGHCDYYRFQSLLLDAEYVFYWNAVSFSCIVRTLSGKPWFTFDEGHLLRGMNAAYASRILDWFYRGLKPPLLEIGRTLSCEALQEASEQYMTSAQQVQQGLLNSRDPQALLSALATQRSAALESNSPA